ncbi:MAG TPA: YceI family protein, partial [Ilumatobacteraceae bacterium]
NARSSVGPITFGAIGVTGFIEVAVAGHRVCAVPFPSAHLEIDVDQLRSGNSLYDAELLRRIDARRHPRVALDLQACTALGSTGRYQLSGQVTFHGVTKPLDGTVSVTMPSDHSLVVRGEQVVDIRDFGVVSPTVLMLRIYPDVVVGLQIEAVLDEPTGSAAP